MKNPPMIPNLRPVPAIATPMDNVVGVGATVPARSVDDAGYVLGRQVLATDALGEIRDALFTEFVRAGHAEREGEQLRWTGDTDGLAPEENRRIKGVVVPLAEDALISSGVLSAVVAELWGRPPAFWTGLRLLLKVPGPSGRTHRDNTHMYSYGEPEQQVICWLPLTSIVPDGGGLAIAEGSHLLANADEGLPAMPHPVHPEVLVHTRGLPPDAELAPLWRNAHYEPGDLLVFRSDAAHGAEQNTGEFTRLAIGFDVQDARLPIPPEAGLSMDRQRHLADIESIIVAMLSIQAMSPWLAQCAFYPGGIIGPHWPEPVDRVKRAFETLTARGLIHPVAHPGDEGKHPTFRYSECTPTGREVASEWLRSRSRPGAEGDRLDAVKFLLASALVTNSLAVGGSTT